MGFAIWLIILFGVQYGLSLLFQVVFGLNYYITDTLINLVLSFLFTIMNFRRFGKEMFKLPEFHKSIAKYFVILMIFSLIFWLL